MSQSIQHIEQEQLRAKINRVNQALSGLSIAALRYGDAIRRMRKALGMSGAALSRRLGGSRTQAANLERYERDEGVSLRNMREAAEAMGCRFVYAIVPPPGKTVEDLIQAQAEKHADEQLQAAAGHMALEAQSLNEADREAELARLRDGLLRTLPKLPRDFWNP